MKPDQITNEQWNQFWNKLQIMLDDCHQITRRCRNLSYTKTTLEPYIRDKELLNSLGNMERSYYDLKGVIKRLDK